MVFPLNGGFFEKKMRDFRVRSGILEEKMHDFRLPDFGVKWGIFWRDTANSLKVSTNSP